MPSLLSTTSEPELFEQLIDRGWAAYGAESGPGEPSTSRLYITHQSLQLVVEGQILLDDLDPTAPPGWWRAVDSFDGRCVVVVVRSEDVDLHDPNSGKTLQRLMDDPESGVWALVPIEHPAAPL